MNPELKDHAQSGTTEVGWAHNPWVPRLKLGSDNFFVFPVTTISSNKFHVSGFNILLLDAFATAMPCLLRSNSKMDEFEILQSIWRTLKLFDILSFYLLHYSASTSNEHLRCILFKNQKKYHLRLWV